MAEKSSSINLKQNYESFKVNTIFNNNNAALRHALHLPCGTDPIDSLTFIENKPSLLGQCVARIKSKTHNFPDALIYLTRGESKIEVYHGVFYIRINCVKPSPICGTAYKVLSLYYETCLQKCLNLNYIPLRVFDMWEYEQPQEYKIFTNGYHTWRGGNLDKGNELTKEYELNILLGELPVINEINAELYYELYDNDIDSFLTEEPSLIDKYLIGDDYLDQFPKDIKKEFEKMLKSRNEIVLENADRRAKVNYRKLGIKPEGWHVLEKETVDIHTSKDVVQLLTGYSNYNLENDIWNIKEHFKMKIIKNKPRFFNIINKKAYIDFDAIKLHAQKVINTHFDSYKKITFDKKTEKFNEKNGKWIVRIALTRLPKINLSQVTLECPEYIENTIPTIMFTSYKGAMLGFKEGIEELKKSHVEEVDSYVEKKQKEDAARIAKELETEHNKPLIEHYDDIQYLMNLSFEINPKKAKFNNIEESIRTSNLGTEQLLKLIDMIKEFIDNDKEIEKVKIENFKEIFLELDKAGVERSKRDGLINAIYKLGRKYGVNFAFDPLGEDSLYREAEKSYDHEVEVMKLNKHIQVLKEVQTIHEEMIEDMKHTYYYAKMMASNVSEHVLQIKAALLSAYQEGLIIDVMDLIEHIDKVMEGRPLPKPLKPEMWEIAANPVYRDIELINKPSSINPEKALIVYNKADDEIRRHFKSEEVHSLKREVVKLTQDNLKLQTRIDNNNECFQVMGISNGEVDELLQSFDNKRTPPLLSRGRVSLISYVLLHYIDTNFDKKLFKKQMVKKKLSSCQIDRIDSVLKKAGYTKKFYAWTEIRRYGSSEMRAPGDEFVPLNLRTTIAVDTPTRKPKQRKKYKGKRNRKGRRFL